MATASPALDPLLADGIAIREGQLIRMPEEARPLVRLLASAFDQYLNRGAARHSRAI